MTPGRARALAALVPPIVLLLVVLGPTLGERDLIATDTRLFVGARDRLIAESLSSGAGIPRWAPGICGGAPALASSELGLLYPPWLAFAWLAPERAVTLGLAFHLLVAALGAYALARELGARERAAILASCAFAFGGALLSAHAMPLLVASNAWLTWVTWGVLRASAGRWSGLLAATLGQLAILLSGDVQLAGVAAFAGLVLVLARDRRQAPRALAAVVASSVGALVLGAAQVVPTAALFDEHARGKGFTFEAATHWSLSWGELPGLVVPFFLGARGDPPSVWADAVTPDQGRAFLETYCVGPVVLALALVGASRWRTSAAARGGALLGVLLLPLALGSHTPLYGWLFRLVPGAPLFRYPAKLAIPASLALALLASAGASALREPAVRRALAALLGVLVLAAALGAVATTAFTATLAAPIDAVGAPGVDGTSAVSALTLRFVHVAAFALGALALVLRRRRHLATALAVLVILDLGLGLRRVFVLVPRDLVESAPRVAEALVELTRRDGAPARVYPAPSAREVELEDWAAGPARGDFALIQGLCPNSGLGRGVFSQDGFLANPPLRWATLELRTRPLAPARRAILWGARYAYVKSGTEGELGGEVEAVALVGSRTLVRLVAAPAWAALYGRVRLAASRLKASDAVIEPGFDPRREVVLETSDALACTPEVGESGRAWLDSPFENERFEVALETPGPGWLVVREAYARGWRATVDGVETTVVPADVGFRAVHVPAGARRVVFVYEAPRLWLGVGVSALGFALLTLLILVRARARQVGRC